MLNKYLLDKYIPNLKEYTFDFCDYKPMEFFLNFEFPLDFIKYLVKEKKADYKQEKSKILKASIYMGKGYNEYLKYFIEDLKVVPDKSFKIAYNKFNKDFSSK